jgi:hypothetical protein
MSTGIGTRPSLIRLFADRASFWLLHQVWPEIRRVLQFEVEKFALDLIQRMTEWLRKCQKQEESLRKKAVKEDGRAEGAADAKEADAHRRIAQVWQEAAQELRLQNESLRRELAGLLESSKSLGEKIDRDLDLREKQNRLMIGKKQVPFPELGSGKISCPQCGADLTK